MCQYWLRPSCPHAMHGLCPTSLQAIARPMHSNPPLHGALLVHTVLSDPGLKQQW